MNNWNSPIIHWFSETQVKQYSYWHCLPPLPPLHSNASWRWFLWLFQLSATATTSNASQRWFLWLFQPPSTTTTSLTFKHKLEVDFFTILTVCHHEDFTLLPLFRSESTGVHRTPLDSTGLQSIPNGTGTPSDFESHESPLHFSSWNRAESTGNKHWSPVIVQSNQPEF